MTRTVTVGDDLTLPAPVKVADGNLPARLQDAALNATYGIPKLDKAEASTTYLKVSEAPLTPERFGAQGNGSANDTAALNDMFAALVPGGSIQFLPNRRYITAGGHTITTPSVLIQGASGRAQTYNSSGQLYLRNGANVDMLTIAANQVTIRDLTLYGNYNNQTAPSRGLVFPSTSAANYLLLDAVWVDSFNGDNYSFDSSGGTLSGTIKNCESRFAKGYGMRFFGGATDMQVLAGYIDQNDLSGVMCSSGDLSLDGVHIWGNGRGASGDRDGITFQSSNGNRVNNCYIEQNKEGAGIRFKSGVNKGHIVSGCDIWENGFNGIYAFGASQLAITGGNQIRQNNWKGGSGQAGAGIVLDSCTAVNTSGNIMHSTGLNRQTYGYFEVGTANAGCLFANNVSRAADHTTGNWVIAAGTASPTTVGVNVG
ncbi:right-handed parallel beta-helix repeat-containing protein [Paenarthrobacter sp. YJN-5]|uniref:right-handed parallel beta-helix repeat-containing protein n=1 Tax=Paenarthrobacter sp. YJN-5 TaxID=2735316 RepID=UPI001877FBAB|nr:right-handed parallel beta-helix repeat-containing protein [Paenarthrobacter sp. YJN-5]QOT16467.1 right-handed parallel beta-helix repeat-containing protein [Paenarthrobacter sp. YJN-5]